MAGYRKGRQITVEEVLRVQAEKRYPDFKTLMRSEYPDINYKTQMNRQKSDGTHAMVMAAFGNEAPEGGYHLPNDTKKERMRERPLAERLYSHLKMGPNKNGVLVSALADEFDVSPKRIRASVEELEDSGRHLYRVGEVISAFVVQGAERRIDLEITPRDRMKVGVISDTHFGSKKQQPTALREFMLRAADEHDLDCWLHSGDLTDGIPEVYRGHMHEVFTTGADLQVEYAAQAYPETGVPTYAIGGNHDESAAKKAGVNVLRSMASLRDDFHYVDFYGGYVDVGGISFYLWHPPGGASYAKTYKLQRHVEGFGDADKPHVVLAGHLHQFVWMWHRGVHSFLVPSFQATTRFIRRLGYESMVGGLVLEIARDDFGDPVEVTPHLTKLRAKEHDFPGI